MVSADSKRMQLLLVLALAVASRASADADQPANNSAAQDGNEHIEDAQFELSASVASASSGSCHVSVPDVRQCSIQCFSKKRTRADCITTCLQQEHNVAQSCAKCYGQRSDCTINNCLNKCSASAYSSPCRSCVRHHCGGECPGNRRLRGSADQAAQASDSANATEAADTHAETGTEADVSLTINNTTPELLFGLPSPDVEDVHLEMSASVASFSTGSCHASEHALRRCSIRCYSKQQARAECISRCLHHDEKLGQSCASCYGQRSDCTINNCLRECSASASGSPCRSCVRHRCGGECPGSRRMGGSGAEQATEESGSANVTATADIQTSETSTDADVSFTINSTTLELLVGSPSSSLTSLAVSSEEAQDSCHAGLLGSLYKKDPDAARRCLSPCRRACPALNDVATAYVRKGGKPAAKKAICRRRQDLRCLVDHIGGCMDIVHKAAAFGLQLPTTHSGLDATCR